MDVTVVKLSGEGRMTLPVSIRRRWNVDRVVVLDLPTGVLIRPHDPHAAARIAGSYRRVGAPTVDEVKAAERRAGTR